MNMENDTVVLRTNKEKKHYLAVMKHMKSVSETEYMDFIKSYPRHLVYHVDSTQEPTRHTLCDLSLNGIDMDAMACLVAYMEESGMGTGDGAYYICTNVDALIEYDTKCKVGGNVIMPMVRDLSE